MHIDPDYFLDEITDIETEAILDAYEEQYKRRWEDLRFMGHVVAHYLTGEYPTREDFMNFEWDNDDKTIEEEKEKEVKKERNEKEVMDYLIAKRNLKGKPFFPPIK